MSKHHLDCCSETRGATHSSMSLGVTGIEGQHPLHLGPQELTHIPAKTHRTQARATKIDRGTQTQSFVSCPQLSGCTHGAPKTSAGHRSGAPGHPVRSCSQLLQVPLIHAFATRLFAKGKFAITQDPKNNLFPPSCISHK